jgi:AcrR family transcriptional regulator
MISVKTPQTPERGRYHHGDLRNALVETAARLVAERGPEGFSLREAAREVGVSPGAAYRHFADKAALLVALAIDGHARLATALERSIAKLPAPGTAGHAVASLEATGLAYVEFALANPSHFRVMFGPCVEAEGFEPGCAASGRDAYQILSDVLDALVAREVIPAPARAGAEIVAWSAVHGFASLLVDGAVPLGPRERAAVLRGLNRTLLLGWGASPRRLPPAPEGTVDTDPRAAAQRKRRPRA